MFTDDMVKRCLTIDLSDPKGLRWVWHPNKAFAKKLIGTFAGRKGMPGYYQTSILGKIKGNHVLIFFLHNGFWPVGFVDHIDGNPLNNNPENLRDVSASENQHNNRGKGFYWRADRQRWEAKITVNGSVIHLGRFDNMLDARAAYLSAKRRMHPSVPIL